MATSCLPVLRFQSGVPGKWKLRCAITNDGRGITLNVDACSGLDVRSGNFKIEFSIYN